MDELISIGYSVTWISSQLSDGLHISHRLQKKKNSTYHISLLGCRELNEFDEGWFLLHRCSPQWAPSKSLNLLWLTLYSDKCLGRGMDVYKPYKWNLLDKERLARQEVQCVIIVLLLMWKSPGYKTHALTLISSGIIPFPLESKIKRVLELENWECLIFHMLTVHSINLFPHSKPFSHNSWLMYLIICSDVIYGTSVHIVLLFWKKPQLFQNLHALAIQSVPKD